jgi:hypothetical protein
VSGTPLALLGAALPQAQQLARLEEKLAAGQRITTVVLILETRSIPPDGATLDAEHAVVLFGSDLEEQAQVLARLRRVWGSPITGALPELGAFVLVLDLRAGATEIDLAVADGVVREVCGLGARGDGKSVTGAVAWLHAGARHRQRGGAGPFRVLVMTGTMAEHRLRLCETLREPFWKGLWTASNDEHTWTATVGGLALVELWLVGIEDVGGLDRARKPANGLWLEEAAPAGAEVGSTGLTEEALQIGATSLRLESYAHPILVTSNYGSESHWSWRRYAKDRHPGTHLVRLRPGERASAAQRAAAREALEGRPDLIRRLIDGEPALIVQGQGVLEGIFNPAIHVAPRPLEHVEGARLILGHDGGLTPTTVIAEWNGPQLRILAALASTRAGTLQHLRDLVLPWLRRYAAEAELEHWIDPSLATPSQSDLGDSGERQIRRHLGGPVRDGEVKTQARLDPLLGILGQLIEGGRPALLVSPMCEALIAAMSGRWHYPRDRNGQVSRETIEKDHPWSDLGDSLCYAVGGAKPWRQGRPAGPRAPYPAKTGGDPLGRDRRPAMPSDMQRARIIRTPNR